MIDLQQLQDNWPIIGGFVAGLVAFGKTHATASSARAGATKAHHRINDTDKAVSEIRESAARTETHCHHILKSIEELKKEIRNGASRP